MQKVLLNRLKLQAETSFVEEQAGFRAGPHRTEQIFSVGILCKGYLQYQQDHFQVWHKALWSDLSRRFKS